MPPIVSHIHYGVCVCVGGGGGGVNRKDADFLKN